VFDVSASKIVGGIKMLLHPEFIVPHARPGVLLQEDLHIIDELAVRKNESVVVCRHTRLRTHISSDSETGVLYLRQ
jgi:hypothetical protein